MIEKAIMFYKSNRIKQFFFIEVLLCLAFMIFFRPSTIRAGLNKIYYKEEENQQNWTKKNKLKKIPNQIKQNSKVKRQKYNNAVGSIYGTVVQNFQSC